MGRVITRTIAITPEKFEYHKERFNVTQIPDAKVLIGEAGELIVVMNEEWANYLHGKTDIKPE